MQIETILNHLQKFKSFVYKSVRWIEQMKKIGKMLRQHCPLLHNWLKDKKQLSRGIAMGINKKSERTTKKADGYRNF